MRIGEKVHLLLRIQNKKQSELASFLGTKPSTIHGWKNNNRNPSTELILPICDFFQVGVIDFLSSDNLEQVLDFSTEDYLNQFKELTEENKLKIKGMVEIKLYEQRQVNKKPNTEKINKELRKKEKNINRDNENLVIYRGPLAAGKPINHYEDIFEREYMPSPYPQAEFAWKLVGDSMEPKMKDGSIIYTRTVNRSDIKNGDTVVVNINGEYSCKNIYYFLEKELIELHSNNPKHKVQKYYLGEGTDTNIKLEGKVIFD